jgi:hypothetical protein
MIVPAMFVLAMIFPRMIVPATLVYRIRAAVLALALLVPASAVAQTPDPHSVPSVDAGLGTCTADFTIADSDGKPVYDAKISVHIAYGFAGWHKLDLQVGTNVDGKARFTTLPNSMRKGGLYFRAWQSGSGGEAFDDPSKTCQAQFAVTLRKPLTPTP